MVSFILMVLIIKNGSKLLKVIKSFALICKLFLAHFCLQILPVSGSKSRQVLLNLPLSLGKPDYLLGLIHLHSLQLKVGTVRLLAGDTAHVSVNNSLWESKLGSVRVLYKQVFRNSALPLNKQNKHGLRPPPPKMLIWYLNGDLLEYA